MKGIKTLFNNKYATYFLISILFLYFYMISIDYQKYVEVIFLSGTFLLVFSKSLYDYRKNQKINTKVLIYCLLLLSSCLIMLISSEYTVISSFLNTLFIIIVLFYFFSPNLTEDVLENKFIVILYYVSLIFILFNLYIYFKEDYEFFILKSAWDKNFSGIALFLFYLFCEKRKFILGKLLIIFLVFIVGSRSLILLLILFYTLKWAKKFTTENFFTKTKKKIFLLLLSMPFLIILFSNYWVSNVSYYSFSEYGESINDNSNKMRFLANLKAYELIKEQSFLLSGYDDDIKDVLGISSPNTFDHTRYEGMRLVQPHNSVLNLIVKSGIVYTFIYLLILAEIIKRYWNKENIEYIIPYLINSMIMHSLLGSMYLLMWIFIIWLPKKTDRKKKFT